jgi:TctA family transporter
MLMSRGSLGIFFAKPLVTTLILLGAALLLMPVIWRTIGRMLPRSQLKP